MLGKRYSNALTIYTFITKVILFDPDESEKIRHP